MGFLRLFKPPKNQQFSYKPRYWDPKKEEAEKLRQRVETLQKGGVDGMKERISGGFRKGLGGEAAMSYRNRRVKRSNGTLLIVIIVLMVLSYLAIEVYFPDLSSWLGSSELPVAE